MAISFQMIRLREICSVSARNDKHYLLLHNRDICQKSKETVATTESQRKLHRSDLRGGRKKQEKRRKENGYSLDMQMIAK